MSENSPSLTVHVNVSSNACWTEEGSPVSKNENLESVEDKDNANSGPPCNCQNSCQTKDGPKRAGCPCRNLDVYCTEQCRCGTRKYPCENRKTVCMCQNSCQTRTGPKRAGCPCRDEELFCIKRCGCGTKQYPCKNDKSCELSPDVTPTRADGRSNGRASSPAPDSVTVVRRRADMEDNLGDMGVVTGTITKDFFEKRRYTINTAHVSIVNNCTFDRHILEERIGSPKDVETIKKFCNEKDFKHELVLDKTTTDIERYFNKIIEEFAKEFPYDAFICFLMSHGTDDKIYGRSGNLLDIEFIVSKFMYCEKLLGKPKIFFIQACRSKGDILKDGVEQKQPVYLPKHSDTLLAHATFEGLHAYRTRVGGSWFISSLVELLQDHCQEQHLMDIMTVVNEIVATEKATGRHMQMPCQLSTLTKFVYFG